MWSLAASAYALAFFQRVAPQTFLDRLMADFQVGASQVSLITSGYFYGYMVAQAPAGIIVDRWGARRAVLWSLAISGVGTLWFQHSSSVVEATVARALVAGGDALVFSSLIRLATQWFPPDRFGLMSGLSQLSGYLGALFATVPLALAVSAVGWRRSFTVLAWAVASNFAMAALFLREHDHVHRAAPAVSRVLRVAVEALRRSSTWGLLSVAAGAYVASLSLSGVWGTSLLMQGYGLPRAIASRHMLVFMVGYAAGAVCIGFLSDRYFRTLRVPIAILAVARAALLIAVTPAIAPQMPTSLTFACYASLGFVAGATVTVAVSIVKLTFDEAALGTGIGLTAAISNMVAGLAQPLLGRILEAYWTGTFIEGAKVYDPAGYTWVLTTLAAISLSSAAGACIIVDKDRRRRSTNSRVEQTSGARD